MGRLGEDDPLAELVGGERGERDGGRDVWRVLDVDAEEVAETETPVSAEAEEGLAGLCGEASLRMSGATKISTTYFLNLDDV